MKTFTAKPWLSVLMPIYNGENFLASALDSILLQQDADIECIVVDGESSDATASILKNYQSRLPLQILQYKKESDWVIKTNHALSFAKGEYVCFLHHDDFWLDGRLQVMKQLTQQYPDTVLFTHPSYYFDNGNHNLGIWTCPLPATPNVIQSNQMIEALLIQNFISIIAPVFKREIAVKVEGLDEKLWYTADWDFWLKVAKYGSTVYCPKPLSGFRIHSNSQTIVRSAYVHDFRAQLEHVFTRHISNWNVSDHRKEKIKRAALFSIEVNSTLAGAIHKKGTNIFNLISLFILLGPIQAYRYIKFSRIAERVTARLKANLMISHT